MKRLDGPEAAEYETRIAIPARWGLAPRWSKDNSRAAQCINAKAETIDTKPSFRDADDRINPREPQPLALKRLLVPAPDDRLAIRPASPLVNNVRDEGPELLEAV